MTAQRGHASWVGRVGRVEATVEHSDTAISLGSGTVPVLGTPRLIALMEKATCDAVEEVIDDESTTVGVQVDVVHRRPTPVGATVIVTATVVSIKDARVTYDVSADHTLVSGERVEGIGRGTITRAVVDRRAFLSVQP